MTSSELTRSWRDCLAPPKLRLHFTFTAKVTCEIFTCLYIVQRMTQSTVATESELWYSTMPANAHSPAASPSIANPKANARSESSTQATVDASQLTTAHIGHMLHAAGACTAPMGNLLPPIIYSGAVGSSSFRSPRRVFRLLSPYPCCLPSLAASTAERWLMLSS